MFLAPVQEKDPILRYINRSTIVFCLFVFLLFFFVFVLLFFFQKKKTKKKY